MYSIGGRESIWHVTIVGNVQMQLEANENLPCTKYCVFNTEVDNSAIIRSLDSPETRLRFFS